MLGNRRGWYKYQVWYFIYSWQPDALHQVPAEKRSKRHIVSWHWSTIQTLISPKRRIGHPSVAVPSLAELGFLVEPCLLPTGTTTILASATGLQVFSVQLLGNSTDTVTVMNQLIHPVIEDRLNCQLPFNLNISRRACGSDSKFGFKTCFLEHKIDPIQYW